MHQVVGHHDPGHGPLPLILPLVLVLVLVLVPAPTLHRLWRMVAHSQGQVLNSSKLGTALGMSHTTVRTYLELFVAAFLVRLLPPFTGNVKKRLVRSPKVYVRDAGILHALLEIDDFDALAGHPVYGHSWEGFPQGS